MGINSITQFFVNRPIKNGSAIVMATPQSGYYVNDDRIEILTSGELNQLAQNVAVHPRYYTGDTIN